MVKQIIHLGKGMNLKINKCINPKSPSATALKMKSEFLLLKEEWKRKFMPKYFKSAGANDEI